jgi:phosphoglycolate phosphatase
MTRALPADSRDEKTLDACLKTMAVEYQRFLNKAASPYPGIVDLISRLGHEKLRLAVLSNKPDEFTAHCVIDFFGDNLFDPILGFSQSRPRKPDPAGALEICRRWHLAPAQVLYLGDGDTDMKTARAAGMYAVGALWGYRSETDLRESGAQSLIKAPADLLSLVP